MQCVCMYVIRQGSGEWKREKKAGREVVHQARLYVLDVHSKFSGRVTRPVNLWDRYFFTKCDKYLIVHTVSPIGG